MNSGLDDNDMSFQMLDKPPSVKEGKKYSRTAKCCCFGISLLGALGVGLILWSSMSSDDTYRVDWPWQG